MDKPATDTPKKKDTSILLRLTQEQHELLKAASGKLAHDVGLNPSLSAFCVKASTDRARQILDEK